MSVLINMEMPTSCPCELLGIGYDLYCSFAGGIPARVKEYYECCQNGTRPSWCPLVYVPPHGDLIDRSKIEYIYQMQGGVLMTSNKIIDGLPIIIPAEEGET